MVPRFVIILALASFAIGGVAGYYWPWASAVEARVLDQEAGSASGAGTNTAGDKPGMGSAIRRAKPVIGKDEAGNFVLPAALADRFQFIALSDDKVNRKDLRVLGLSEATMDEMDRLISDTLKRAVERGRPLMEDFTRNEDEIVWKVRGDATAKEEKAQVSEELRRILAGNSNEVIAERLLGGIERLAFPCGTEDYFIYVARSPTTPGYLSFNRIKLTERPGGDPLPSPGDSFNGMRDRYLYESISPNGGIAPPVELIGLLEGRNWESLLKGKTGS
ncbi:MAG: hypothetical protein EOP84_04610 [Verrucomicrobiaceae bacterium]|nr:MAG: hypothetical protein EOP84_04610 [Verrucomicrobiaceae bacterium]